MITFLLVFLVGLLSVAFTTKPLILIALKKRLFDAPTEARKIHKKIIPNLGGLTVFTGFLFTVALFVDNTAIQHMNTMLAAGVIIFVIGLKDDIIGVDPMKKFAAQFLAAFILTIAGDIRIMDLGGFVGIHDLSYPFSIGLSVFMIVGLINAYNLIDGIDGLVGCMGLLASVSYALLFYLAGDHAWAMIATALAGSLVGFLFYNVSPAKIFMGDCGSLVIGLLVSIFSIHFMNLGVTAAPVLAGITFNAIPAMAAAIALMPIFDTLRVFAVRILRGNSPFKADRNHMHHRMLDLGMTHTRATLTLTAIGAMFVAVAFYFQEIGTGQLIGTLMLISLVMNIGSSTFAYSRTQAKLRAEEDQIDLNEVDPELELNTASVRPALKNSEFADEVLKRVATHFDPNNN